MKEIKNIHMFLFFELVWTNSMTILINNSSWRDTCQIHMETITSILRIIIILTPTPSIMLPTISLIKRKELTKKQKLFDFLSLITNS